MDTKESKGCLFVGEGVTISGEIDLPGTVFVDGVINGQIKANELFVGITGEVNGTVTVSKADIRGAVSDTIEIHDHITVRSGARLQGSVKYQSLEIERGSIIEGKVDYVATLPQPAPVAISSITESPLLTESLG